jgi:hypothetical protein
MSFFEVSTTTLSIKNRIFPQVITYNPCPETLKTEFPKISTTID